MRSKKQVFRNEETVEANETVEAVEAEVVKEEDSKKTSSEKLQSLFPQDLSEYSDITLTSIEKLDSEISKVKVGTDGWANRLFKLVTKIYLEVKVLKADKA